jgi:hypothetical protein
MRVLLLHADRNFDGAAAPPPGAQDLVQDLGLDRLFQVMARGDEVVDRAARAALLGGLGSVEAIRYRQRALADAIEHPEMVHGLYRLAGETLGEERKLWSWFGRTPELDLHHGIDVMELLVRKLRSLRQTAAENVDRCGSPAFRNLFSVLLDELGDAYFAEILAHLRRLRFPDGVLVSAGLGDGNAATDFVLRRPLLDSRGWWERLRSRGDPRLRFEIHPRDDAGHQAIAEARARGINLVADALARSSQHVLGFFSQLRSELAFLVGCLNLREALEGRGCALTMPEPEPGALRGLSATGLYDAVLALAMPTAVVANDLAASGRSVVLITGANRGGKSTFLRSVGIAQLMMQAGMFVPAAAYSAGLASGVFTHFGRGEDETMAHGKLDEELDRMSEIVGRIRPGGMLLCNESFASTNEREAAEIGDQVFRALIDSGVRVLLVTHTYELARRLAGHEAGGVLSLRAERLADGARTFRVREGAALPTSHGRDVFNEVFGAR